MNSGGRFLVPVLLLGVAVAGCGGGGSASTTATGGSTHRTAPKSSPRPRTADTSGTTKAEIEKEVRNANSLFEEIEVRAMDAEEVGRMSFQEAAAGVEEASLRFIREMAVEGHRMEALTLAVKVGASGWLSRPRSFERQAEVIVDQAERR